MRHSIIIIFLILTFCNCKSQTTDKILNTEEMTKTSLDAMNFIKTNNFESFKNLFPTEIQSRINEEKILAVYKYIHEIVTKEGIPVGESIQQRLTKNLKGGDTIYVNVIAFVFKDNSGKTNPFKKEITFSYLEKYGTGKIVGVNVTSDPLNAKGLKINITKLDTFSFSVNNIKLYNIFYKEEKNKNTLFGKGKGLFRLEGDKEKATNSNIISIFENIFKELKKSKIEKSEEFFTALNRGENTEFIQAEFMFDNLKYGLFIYLPIKTDSVYKNKIIIRQMEAANLGYQYYLDFKGNEKLIKSLKSIIKKDWGEFYSENP